MSKCGKCDKVVGESDCLAKCVDCKLSFHATCTRAGSLQSFTKSRNKTLKCDSCVEDSKSSASNRSNDDKDSILEAIRTLKVDIYKKIDDKVNDVLTSVSLLQSDVQRLQEGVTRLDNEHEKLIERCNELEGVNSELTSEVSDLQLRLHDAEQHSRAANIEILGMPVSQKEDIYLCLQHIARALGVTFNEAQISIAHRLRIYSKDKHAYPPIIIQFTSRRTKEAWMSAIRKKRSIDTADIHPSIPASTVYINEHLTPNNKTLLGKARRLKREGRLYSAGYFNGKVLAKESEKAEAVRITRMSDFKKLKLQSAKPTRGAEVADDAEEGNDDSNNK